MHKVQATLNNLTYIKHCFWVEQYHLSAFYKSNLTVQEQEVTENTLKQIGVYIFDEVFSPNKLLKYVPHSQTHHLKSTELNHTEFGCMQHHTRKEHQRTSQQEHI